MRSWETMLDFVHVKALYQLNRAVISSCMIEPERKFWQTRFQCQGQRCAIEMTCLAEHWCIFMKSSHYYEEKSYRHFPCEDVYLLFIQIKSTKTSVFFSLFYIWGFVDPWEITMKIFFIIYMNIIVYIFLNHTSFNLYQRRLFVLVWCNKYFFKWKLRSYSLDFNLTVRRFERTTKIVWEVLEHS